MPSIETIKNESTYTHLFSERSLVNRCKEAHEIRFVEDENFSGWLRTASTVIGALLIVLPTKFMDESWPWFAPLLCGLVLVATGRYASLAHTLRIKPFENGYKKVNDGYKTTDANPEK